MKPQMKISIAKNFSYLFLLYSVFAMATNSYQQSSEQYDISVKEQKIVDSIYNLSNQLKRKESYLGAHKFLNSMKTTKAKAQLNFAIASYHSGNGSTDSSLAYINRSIELADKISNSKDIERFLTQAYNVKAYNYQINGLFEESKKWYFKALEINKNLKNKKYYLLTIAGLAEVYRAEEDYEKALELFQEFGDKSDNKILVASSYESISEIYDILSHKKHVNKLGERVKTHFKDYEDHGNCPGFLSKEAETFFANKEFERAIETYQKIIEKSKKVTLPVTALNAKIKMYQALNELGSNKKARSLLSSSLNDAIMKGYYGQQLEIYTYLQNTAIEANNFEEAYNYLTKITQLKDSITTIQRDTEVKKLEIQFETFKKDQKIDLLNKDKELQLLEISKQKNIRTIIILGALAVLIPTLGVLVLFYQKAKTRKQLIVKQDKINEQNIQSILKDQELEIIKVSMEVQDRERERISRELHDSIGGNLAAIKLQLNEEKPFLKEINAQIDNTYEQVRNLSHDLMPPVIRKNDFTDVIESYLHNISRVSKVPIAFSSFTKEKINQLNDKLQIEIFKIIQELITNSLKHAKASTIELQINTIDQEINIHYEDDGIGFDPEQRTTGIGLKNIESRIKNLNGQIKIDTAPNKGAIFIITLKDSI